MGSSQHCIAGWHRIAPAVGGWDPFPVSRMGPDELRLPGDGTSCFEALPSSWEDVLAAQEGLGVGL